MDLPSYITCFSEPRWKWHGFRSAPRLCREQLFFFFFSTLPFLMLMWHWFLLLQEEEEAEVQEVHVDCCWCLHDIMKTLLCMRCIITLEPTPPRNIGLFGFPVCFLSDIYCVPWQVHRVFLLLCLECDLFSQLVYDFSSVLDLSWACVDRQTYLFFSSQNQSWLLFVSFFAYAARTKRMDKQRVALNKRLYLIATVSTSTHSLSKTIAPYSFSVKLFCHFALHQDQLLQ